MNDTMSLRQRQGMSSHKTSPTDNSNRDGDEKNGKSNLNIASRSVDGFIAFGVICLVYACVVFFIHVRLNSYPAPKLLREPDLAPTDFVEEKVRILLNKFVDLGPRVTGSVANIRAKDLILETVNDIKKSVKPSHEISIDQQIVDGDFAIDFLVGHLTSVYKNINNVVVKFSPKENPSNHSVLVNCHYDTFIDTPGASDDTVSCCVMLEMLRCFSQHEQPLKHNIIFLFNGAEENILQASHGFITKHPWGKSIRTFVNLEATGAGGWEMVFQTGPENPWLIRSYINSAKYPSASVISQEIFQTGKIPGDTDFRIFRDYGNLAGLDIAHIKYGYVYHTKNDLPRFIQPGSIQRGGENLMSLVKNLVSSSQLVNPGPEKHGGMVFYDFIGYFMVSYPMRMAAILNFGISSLVLLTVFKKIVGFNTEEKKGLAYVKDLFLSVLVVILTWIVMLLTSVGIALLLTVLDRELSWYTHTSNLIWLYIIPPLTSAVTLHWLLKKTIFKRYNSWSLISIFYDANMVIWVFLLITTTYCRIASSYVGLLWVLFPLLLISRFAVSMKIRFQDKPVTYFTLQIGSVFFPAMYTIYVVYLLTMLVMPIMARSGTEVKPDIPVAILLCIPLFLLGGYHISFVYISRNIGKLIITLLVISVTGVIVVIFTEFGFPFSSNVDDASMQRVMLVHFDRIDHLKDGETLEREANIWHFQLDHHGHKSLLKYSTVFENYSLAPCDTVYCGMPFYFPVLHMIDSRKTLIMPAPRLKDHPRSKVTLLNKEKITLDTFRMTFQVEGQDHITNFIQTRSGVKLLRWSLEDGDPLPVKTLSVFDQPTYYIYYSHETKPSIPWQFSITVYVDKSKDENEVIIDFSSVGHYLHGDLKVTPYLAQVLKKLPQWCVPISVTSTVDTYQF